MLASALQSSLVFQKASQMAELELFAETELWVATFVLVVAKLVALRASMQLVA